MADPATLTINGTDVTGPSEWEATWEERIDGVGQANLTVQDRDPSSAIEYGRGTNFSFTEFGVTVPSQGWRDIVKISIPGLTLYQGEIVDAELDLPVGHPWRRWALSASDFNTIMDLRLVGVPDGLTWETIDGGQTHTAIDPNAVGLATDGATMQALFANYVELPLFVGPTTIGTSTYVHDWIPTSTLIDPITGLSRLLWTNNTVRGAKDELSSLAGFPIFGWIDPDLEFHWEVFKDWTGIEASDFSMLFPTVPFQRFAPARISDQEAEQNGSTVIGGRKLKFKYDATYMPQQSYITGVTDFIHNASGTTTYQGTGWPARTSGRRTAILNARQLLLDAEAVTDAQKGAIAHTVGKYSFRARLRGTVTVGQPDEAVDGWRVGQLLTIDDVRMPPGLRGHSFPIQRVQGKVKKGQTTWREYVLEFGDFPIATFSQKYRTTPQRLKTARLPAKSMIIEWPTHHLRPDTSYNLISQLVDRSKKPVRYAGLPVTWELTVLDGSGINVGGGSLVASTDTTDAHGRAAATLTTGSTTGLHYHVKAFTDAQL